MKFAAFRGIAVCIVWISCNIAPMLFAGESCKCPKNPGPGGGVQCAKDQIATCDPSSGECNCTCDSVQRGKSKEEYEALILSKVLKTEVDTGDLSSPQYDRFLSSFRKGGNKGTFNFDKSVIGNGQAARVQVGVPEWLESVISGKGGVSIGPGATLQDCPNGICIGGENSGTATVNNFAPPQRTLTPARHQVLVSLLRQSGAFSLVVRHAQGDFEAQTYSDYLVSVLKEAGWTVNDNPGLLVETRQGQGVRILANDINNPPLGAVALQKCLKQVGIDAGGSSAPAIIGPKEFLLYVGVEK
jgi:hypothetical protein